MIVALGPGVLAVQLPTMYCPSADNDEHPPTAAIAGAGAPSRSIALRAAAPMDAVNMRRIFFKMLPRSDCKLLVGHPSRRTRNRPGTTPRN